MRLIRHWKVPSVLDRKYKASIELVFKDSEGDRINAMIRPFHVRQFDAILNDGNVYAVSNVAIAPNDIKFKTMTHKYRLIFKGDTRIQPSVDDDKIRRQQFHFLPTSKILSETRDDVYLIDYMGLLIAKGESTKFTKNKKPSFLIGIVLDDMTYYIHLRVADASGEALFGDDLEKYLEDIKMFVGKIYIFKVNAAMSSVTYFQPCIITISKITSDNELLKLYMIKYNLDPVPNDGSVAISTKSSNGAAASGAHISNPQESFAKTPSPPALKKSRLSQKDTIVIGTPGPKGSDIHGSPIANSNEFKPSAQKNLMIEFNLTTRKGGKKLGRLNLDKNG
ncbi:hypothetical protein PIB30_068790 [Stylosanthes scabra]|uniref:Replication protein A 70 kDa DNA-binding subunit B/D first OB fold domain-containing protein n=1 Tax=Stylosanthes scabra TaxID=79078 RepID=A0ABU6UQ71_9FABA|nr:hypothetical protein [Stylosanthes scabra]